MSVGAPSRPLDEFEQLVYEYTQRLGLGGDSHGNEEVLLPISTQEARSKKQQLTDKNSKQKRWDINAETSNFRFESATEGPPAQVNYLLTVTPDLCNYMDNLHGGCAATIIDIFTTTILLAKSRPGVFALGGVSRHLKTTYLRPVPLGTEIRLRCTLIQIGRRLAYLRAEILRADNGDLCVLGDHEKANTDPEVDGKL